MRAARRTAAAGFTLIEVLAVVLLMAIVLGVAIDFYLDLTNASRAAMRQTQAARRAAVLLDRVARDLESAVLVRKPAEVDPLEHPWLFLADADDPDTGADRLKFVSRGRRPRSLDRPESDLELVAWTLERNERGELELRRWSRPGLPEGLERDFPSPLDSELVADGIATFGVRLQAEDGTWTGRWDSSQLVDSAALPVAAEVQVALYLDEETDEATATFTRAVRLPLPPLDLEKQLDVGGGDGELVGEPGDEDGDGIPDDRDDDFAGGDDRAGRKGACVTVGQCAARYPGLVQQLGQFGVQPETLNSISGQCARDFAGVLQGFLPPDCLQ